VILRRALVASVLVAFPLAAPAQLVPCEDQGDVDTVASALSAIERSVETKRPVRRIGRLGRDGGERPAVHRGALSDLHQLHCRP
jgi:hypothetical protein